MIYFFFKAKTRTTYTCTTVQSLMIQHRYPRLLNITRHEEASAQWVDCILMIDENQIVSHKHF